jgi:hypothetical protein
LAERGFVDGLLIWIGATFMTRILARLVGWDRNAVLRWALDVESGLLTLACQNSWRAVYIEYYGYLYLQLKAIYQSENARTLSFLTKIPQDK